MQKQLTEESQVLDELKEQEEADECELGTLQSELSEKTAAISTLNEELKKRSSDKEKLEADLKKSFAEFKTLLDKYETLRENREGDLLKIKELDDANQRLLRSLKEKDEAHKNAVSAAKTETADKEALASSLQNELKKLEEENRALSHKLTDKTSEFKAELEKERADFRLNYEKMEAGTAQAEKALLRELEALRDSLRQKAAETARFAVDIQALTDKQEALKADYEARLLKLDAQNSAVRTQREAGLMKIKEQDIFSQSAVSALREKDDDLQLLNGRIEDLTKELAKNKADSQRRLELLRLELEEKSRHADYLNREIEKNQAEKEGLKKELLVREKEFNLRLEQTRKGVRPGPEKN
jgi:chromosome segregation ATPase